MELFDDLLGDEETQMIALGFKEILLLEWLLVLDRLATTIHADFDLLTTPIVFSRNFCNCIFVSNINGISDQVVSDLRKSTFVSNHLDRHVLKGI